MRLYHQFVEILELAKRASQICSVNATLAVMHPFHMSSLALLHLYELKHIYEQKHIYHLPCLVANSRLTIAAR